RSGRVADAATTIEEAIDWGRAHGERWCMPEVLRIQAAILAAQERLDQAEAALVDSIAMARDIGALSWRLRATSDLARLWCSRSRFADARELLLPVLSAFTEGFATRDLVVAADLIAERSIAVNSGQNSAAAVDVGRSSPTNSSESSARRPATSLLNRRPKQ
ncbi:MAG TPA: hypothetical protein VGC79_17010, partial [Polyangiaceae bacterium]